MSSANREDIDLDRLVAKLKAAARRPDAAAEVRTLLSAAVADPARLAAAMPAFEEDDVILFEDETVSIWHCRFQPGVTVPPHDHQMPATVALYHGRERNQFYQNDPARGIRESGRRDLVPGDVLSIGPSAIHSVTCISDDPCRGIHVYLGKLTEVERSLFDLETDEKLPFTDDAYHRLERHD